MADAITDALSFFDDAASNQLSGEIIIKRVADSVSFKNFYANQVNLSTNSFKTAVGADSSVASAFSLTQQSMLKDLNSLDDLDISVLTSQTILSSQLPGRVTDISANTRLVAYQDRLSTLISDDTVEPASYNNRNEN